MSSILEGVLRIILCLPALRDGGRPGNEGIQLLQNIWSGPTPTPTAEASESEFFTVRARCAKLEQEYETAKAEGDALAETKRKLEDELRDIKELLEEKRRESDHKDASIQRLKKEIQTKLDDSRTAAACARGLSARLSEKDKLLSERTAELSAARAFLTKVDTASEAEVVGMVENLNTLISSASGALSSTWGQRELVPGTLVEELDSKQIRDDFGDLISGEVAARNSVAVALAVEMYLARFVERVTSGWGGGAAAGTLGEIYGMISVKESQAMASRWRTLTKRYTPRQDTPRREEIIGYLARILMLTQSFSDFPEAVEAVGSSVGTEIEAIIGTTLRFEDTIKTKIISSDMRVYVVPPGATFVGETMTDGFGRDGTRDEGREPRVVAGTMEIGLLRKVDNVEKVLRKPKVILESDLPDPDRNE